MIKITPLGVGGAFTEDDYHNNHVFELGKARLLVDVGTTIRYSIRESIYDWTDITDILITHLHSDHVGGLEELAQRCKFVHDHRPNLWVREDMLLDLSNVISKGLRTDGFDLMDYFNICPFDVREGFCIRNYKIQTIVTDNLHAKGMKSFGFKLSHPHSSSVLFTSDIANLKKAGFQRHIDSDTVVFHDCSITESPVHSSLTNILSHYGKDLVREQFVMMHYQDSADKHIKQIQHGLTFAKRGLAHTI